MLRRLSESSHLPCPGWLLPRALLTPCSRQLIPVSQPNLIPPEVTEQPTNDAEYARLFNERFASMRKHVNRPSSAGAGPAQNDEDETTWLERVLGGQSDEEVDHIKPTKGGLTIQFGAR